MKNINKFLDKLRYINADENYSTLILLNREIMDYIILDLFYEETYKKINRCKNKILKINQYNVYDYEEIELSELETIKERTRKPNNFELIHTTLYFENLSERMKAFDMSYKEVLISYALHMTKSLSSTLYKLLASDLNILAKYVTNFYSYFPHLKIKEKIEDVELLEYLVKDYTSCACSMAIYYKFNINDNNFIMLKNSNCLFTYVKMDLESIISHIDCSDCIPLNKFEGYEKEINIMSSLLLKHNDNNLFIHGNVGLGKTELAKSLVNSLNKKIIVITPDTDNKSILDDDFKNSADVLLYKLNKFVKSKEKDKLKNYIVLIDECDDIFLMADVETPGYKRMVNEILELDINKIFISNYPEFDECIMRRFDYIFEMKNKYKNTKKDFLNKYIKVIKDPHIFKQITKNKFITISVLEKCYKVMACIDSYTEKDAVKYLNNYLKHSGYKKAGKIKPKKRPKEDNKDYNINYINSSVNFKEVVNNLKEKGYKNTRMLLYGPPGSGKTEFAKTVSKELGLKTAVIRNSDILSKFVGEAEQNLAKAFKEAKEKNKVLIFDEVDSLIYDRSSGEIRNHELNLVTEFLQQLDNFDGMIVATTNILDKMDKASIRRFDLKAEFKSLKVESIIEIFNKYLEELNIKKTDEYENIISQMSRLHGLCMGDFISVKRNHRFNTIKTDKDLFGILLAELELKGNKTKKVGF